MGDPRYCESQYKNVWLKISAFPNGGGSPASSFGCASQEAMKAEEEAAMREFQAGNSPALGVEDDFSDLQYR